MRSKINDSALGTMPRSSYRAGPSRQRVRLPAPRLPVREQRGVVPAQRRLHDVATDGIEHHRLTRVFIEHIIERKHVSRILRSRASFRRRARALNHPRASRFVFLFVALERAYRRLRARRPRRATRSQA
jgi:hypothetical protein